MSWTIGRKVVRAASALLIFTATIGVFTASTAEPALADNCSTEQTIFAYDQTTIWSHGTIGNIYIRNHLLDSNCSENPGAWSMVNLITTDYVDQVETGYREYAGPAFDDVTCYQAGNQESCPLNKSVGINPGNTDGFKVSNYPVDSTDFQTYIKGANGWIETSSTTGAPFTHGYSMGETGRYGDNTGMVDHHSSLQEKDANGTWESWGGDSFAGDPPGSPVDGGTYYWHWMSQTQYEVCEVGGPCPWQ